MSKALDTLAALTGAAVAVTDLMQVARQLGREPTEEELDEVLATSMAKHQRARELVEIARKREEAAKGPNG